MDIVLDKFADPAGGGFFYTATDHEQLITRTKELTDSSMPSGNALAATALLRLGALAGRATTWTRPKRRLRRGRADHGAGAAGRRPNAARARSLLGAEPRAGARGQISRVTTKASADGNFTAAFCRGVCCGRTTLGRTARPSPVAAERNFRRQESSGEQPTLFVLSKFCLSARCRWDARQLKLNSTHLSRPSKLVLAKLSHPSEPIAVAEGNSSWKL